MTTTEMKVNLGNEFTISLKANPTAGYAWEAEYDENILDLKDKIFKPDFPATVGGKGKYKFVFSTVKTGKTDVVMFYKRQWETKSLEEKVFRIIIE